VPTETLAPLSVAEIEDQLRRNASSIDEPKRLAERLHRATGGFLIPFRTILKAEHVLNALDRFLTADLNPVDFGIPMTPAARKALGVLLTYVSPSEELRISDLESIEPDTGVNGGLLADWLLGIGLAEQGMSADQLHNGGGVIRLNPILRHPAVLRTLGISS
jgi:hypothetical protein